MFKIGELARDVGTVVIGEEAVKTGLIHEIGGLSQAIRKLREMIEEEEKKELSEKEEECDET